MAFVIPEASLPLGDSLTAHTTNIPSCITYPAVEEGSAFEIKQHMLNILPTFHGLSSDDPNMHIAEFLMGCKNILVRGFSAESIKLYLFPYTLKDQARRWLLTLPSGSISTWAQLSENFLNKYYPASKTLDMRTQILSFAQKPNEEFHEAWERFKELIRKCPHSGINTTDQMHIFFRGLNMTTKTLVNASCGGSCKDKNAQEACLLFEKMAADTQQWAVEQPQSRSIFEMSNGSPYVTVQIEKMEKRLDAKFDMLLQRIPGSQVAVQQPLQAACSICSLTNHDFLSCPHKDAYPEFMAEQVNSFNNFQRPRYDPYSNFYNPGWKDHPNLKWDKDQHSRPQFQQQVQQHAAPKAAWEVAIEKLANTTSQEIQNLHASMKNMEKQIGQIALQVSERAPDSGQSQDRSENTAKATTKTTEHVYEPPMPYPERLKPRAKNQQLTDFMKTLAKVQINLPLIDAIKNIPSYAKFFKDVCEGELKPTSSIIQLADRSITYLRGVIEDVIVKVDNLYLPADFMVLDMDEDLTTPIILGRPFLATTRTLIDVEAGTLTFQVEDQTVVFKLFEASIHSGDKQECMRVDALDGLPSAKFMNRSSTDHLSIKPPNLTRDCTSLKPQQQRVLHEDQPINTMKKHENLPSNPNFKKIQPGKKVWLLSSDFKSFPGKQESRWKGPFLVTKVFQNGNVDIKAKGTDFSLKVTKHQLKPCIEKFGVGKSSTLKEPVI
ncbi:uncharacterized protein [Malus domestica]|uniref:uncharacterized protein n=1 Tax=Malus domestica TaxID=3750 RepID=UPI003976833E